MESIGIEEKYRLEKIPNPYGSAVDQFSHIQQLYSPLDKINCLLNAIATMKTEVIDYWGGKEVVETMDDEFPILIYINVRSEVQYIASEILFL